MASPTTASSTKKTVYLIRHAESEENRRLGSLKNIGKAFSKFSLPSSSDIKASVELLHVTGQVDSAVSPVGTRQIANMGEQLRDSNFVVDRAVELVAHSPLLRARLTSEGLLGCMAPDLKADAVQRVEEVDTLREKYPSEWIPGNYESFKTRIATFEAWLQQQPEERVCIVGHSQYFKAMLGLDFKFRNCDVWQVDFDPSRKDVDATTSASAEETAAAASSSPSSSNDVEIDGRKYTLPPSWSGLQRLYTCTVVPDEKTEASA